MSAIAPALRYEWRRLWTIRSTYWLIVIALVFQAVMSGLIAWRLPESGPSSAGDQPFEQLATIGASTGIAPLFVAYILGIIGVFSMGHEYRHGMIRATLTAIPSRRAVIVAKVATTGVVSGVVALACVGLALLAEVIFGVGGPSVHALVDMTLGVVVFTVLFTWSGLAFAGIVRNQTGAVAMLMLVPSVVETIIRAVVLAIKAASDDPRGTGGLVRVLRFLPYDAGGQMYTRTSIDQLLSFLGYRPFGPVGGGVVMAVFVAALLALWAALFVRRDA